MNYPALKAELALPAYAGMSDDQIIATLNASTIAASVEVQIGQVLMLLYEQGTWANIKKSTNSSAAALVQLQQDFHTVAIDMTGSFAQTMLAAMSTAGLLTSAQIAALTALSHSTISRASQLGWPDGVKIGDLQTARVQP